MVVPPLLSLSSSSGCFGSSMMSTGAPPLSLKTIVLAPTVQLAVVTAARSVQRPFESAQMPSLGFASGASAVEVTVMVLDDAVTPLTASGDEPVMVAGETPTKAEVSDVASS